MKPALNRGLKKLGRDLLQVIAAGGAVGVITLITGHLDPAMAVIVAFGFKLLTVFAQNTLETKGTIPVFLPTPGLVTTAAGGTLGKAVGTVDAVTEGAGQVVGDVLDTTGKTVGGVVGAVGGLLGAAPEVPPDVETLGGI